MSRGPSLRMAKLVPSTKVVMEKSTTARRSSVSVSESQSRSILPCMIMSSRFSVVTGTIPTFRSGSLSCWAISLATASQSWTMKPAGWPFGPL